MRSFQRIQGRGWWVDPKSGGGGAGGAGVGVEFGGGVNQRLILMEGEDSNSSPM